MKNNKEEITVELEEQDTGTLGKLCSERKACSRKWLATLSIRQTNVHYVVPICSSDRYRVCTWMILPPEIQVVVN